MGSRIETITMNESKEKVNSDKICLSFAGCGFTGVYHIGVASCLKLCAPQLLRNKIGGSSSGAMCALALTCDVPLENVTRFVISLSMRAKENTLGPFSPSFQLSEIVRRHLDSVLPDNVAEIVSGKLFVSITRLKSMKNLLVSEFRDKNDVIEAIVASSFVPVMSGLKPPKFRGEYALDGIYSDALPRLGDHTITVSPFKGDVSISPPEESRGHMSLPYGSGGSVHVSKHNVCKLKHSLIPPNIQNMKSFCEQGFSDARRFLLSDDCPVNPFNREKIHLHCELPPELSEVFKEFGECSEKPN